MVHYIKNNWEPAFTYRDLSEGVIRCAHTYGRLGIRPGDRIVLIMPNCSQYPVAFFGALLAGAIIVPLDVGIEPGRLKWILKDCGARTVVTWDLCYQKVIEVLPETVERVMVASYGEVLSPFKRMVYRWTRCRDVPQLRPGDFDFWELIWSLPPYPPELRIIPDDPAVLLYPGTGDEPCGELLSHNNLAANIDQFSAWIADLQPRLEIILTTVPFTNILSLVCGLLLAVKYGGTIVMVDQANYELLGRVPQFYRPSLCLGNRKSMAGLQEGSREPTRSNGPEAGFNSIIIDRKKLPLRLDRELAPVEEGTVLTGFGPPGGGLTHMRTRDDEPVSGSIGLPVSGTEARLIDRKGDPVSPDGEGEGELQVRGPQVTAGLWRSKDATDLTEATDVTEATEPIDGKGWLSTGLVASMVPSGAFRIRGRTGDQED